MGFAGLTEDPMIYKTGETPGKGTYRCTKCGFLVHLYRDDEKLPACPACMHSEYTKVD